MHNLFKCNIAHTNTSNSHHLNTFHFGILCKWALTLSAPTLQSYVICRSCMRQKFHFSKMLILPWLTIVLHRITKENLHFSPKKGRVHYNLAVNMCYPLFASRSKFNYPENTNWWRIQEEIFVFCITFSLIDH